jgi:hypothetical protein
MNKNTIRLFLVCTLCVVLISSCSQKIKTTTVVPNQNGEPPIAETTIDTKKPLSPAPTTGEKAENDPVSLLVIDYFKAIQAGQYDRAYNMTDGEFRKKKGSFTEFLQPLAQAAANGRIYDKVTIISVTSSESGMEKIVTFKIAIYEKQTQMTLDGIYVVVQQKDQPWKIFDTITD